MTNLAASQQTIQLVDIPLALQQLPQPVTKLFGVGNTGLLDRSRQEHQASSTPYIAIVGSRRVSLYGRATTTQIGEYLAERGVVIISGLALGVDALAHQAAVRIRAPTIAVLPGPLEDIYPAVNRSLARAILDNGGLLVSEYPADYPERGSRYMFLARNRIIAALSDAVLVTEAAQKSGSLHTVNYGLERGKTIMTVPGSIYSETSVGTNNLLRQGAVPITKPEEVLLALGLTSQNITEKSLVAQNPQEQAIIDVLQQGITDEDQLLSQSKLDPRLFAETLTMLELTGGIRCISAGHWIIL